MADIMTGAGGRLAFWNAKPQPEAAGAFDVKGNFYMPESCSFAGLSAFADNANHPPAALDGAVTWDAGIDLLFRIAGQR